MKVTLPYLVVLVVRGEGSKTPKVVLPHEVEILRAQFGDDAIVETNDKPHINEAEFETEEEYARLQETYRGDADNPNPTARVFRNLADFEAAFESAASSGSSALTAAQLKEKLTELGVEFPPRANKEQLEALLAEHKGNA